VIPEIDIPLEFMVRNVGSANLDALVGNLGIMGNGTCMMDRLELTSTA
jgi:hypothetical protein